MHLTVSFRFQHESILITMMISTHFDSQYRHVLQAPSTAEAKVSGLTAVDSETFDVEAPAEPTFRGGCQCGTPAPVCLESAPCCTHIRGQPLPRRRHAESRSECARGKHRSHLILDTPASPSTCSLQIPSLLPTGYRKEPSDILPPWHTSPIRVI